MKQPTGFGIMLEFGRNAMGMFFQITYFKKNSDNDCGFGLYAA